MDNRGRDDTGCYIMLNTTRVRKESLTCTMTVWSA